MSKKSKSISKQKNLREKQAKKASQRALYESYKRSGENTKSSRNKKSNRKNKKSTKGLHLIAHCGNIACRKCFKVTETGVYSITRNPKKAAA